MKLDINTGGLVWYKGMQQCINYHGNEGEQAQPVTSEENTHKKHRRQNNADSDDDPLTYVHVYAGTLGHTVNVGGCRPLAIKASFLIVSGVELPHWTLRAF